MDTQEGIMQGNIAVKLEDGATVCAELMLELPKPNTSFFLEAFPDGTIEVYDPMTYFVYTERKTVLEVAQVNGAWKEVPFTF